MLDWIKKAAARTIQGNYKFYIKTQNDHADTSTTIRIDAFTDKSETSVVPCQYRWFRIRNNIIQQNSKFKGNIYVCDTSDIAAVIQVQVTSQDFQFSGQAKVQFGPVRLSPQLRKHLTDTLTNNSTFIKGMICFNQIHQKQCQFKIFQDCIKICHLQSDIGYNFHYNQFEPRVQLMQKDPTKLSMTFSSNYQSNPHIFLKNLFVNQYQQSQRTTGQCRFQLRFPSKLIKQMFQLTLKAFTTKRQLKNSVVMHKLEQLSFTQNENIDLLLQIQSLRSDITRLFNSKQNKQKQILRLTQQNQKLQRQIQQIVTTYTRMTEDKLKNSREVNDGYSILTTKRQQVFGRKCQNLQKQNSNLNQRIRALTAQIDQIRINSSMAQKNQTMVSRNPNLTHVTTIRMANQTVNNATSFNNILQNLQQSRVTSFSQDSFLLNKQLQKANQQKIQLQKKLQKSFRTIYQLQNKLQTKSQLNFMKKDTTPPQINTSAYSLAVDLQKIRHQNKKLSCLNESLIQQNKNLKKQVISNSRVIIKPSLPVQVAANNQSLKQSVTRQKSLNIQRQNLIKQVAQLKQSLMAEQSKVQKYLKDKMNLQRKVQQLNKEIQMLKKNQQAINRSQNLSMDIDGFNEQKIRVLKENNEFLMKQNQKLSKLCQRFMQQGRQNTKLRKQILQLKQKATKGKLLNPQKSQFKSILTGSANNMSKTSDLHISELLGKSIANQN